MPNIDIALLGDKALEKKLGKLTVQVQKKVARSALRKAATQTVKKKAQEYAPVDSGRLKTGIEVKSIPRSRRRIGVLVQTKSRDHFDIDQDDKHYYPAVVEFGSETQPAQSYLRRAKDSQAGAFFSAVGRHIAQGIKRLT